MRKDKERKLAEAYGATSQDDANRGFGWQRFFLNEWHIWECVHAGNTVKWAKARLVNNMYVDHAYYNSLKEVFESIKPKDTNNVCTTTTTLG